MKRDKVRGLVIDVLEARDAIGDRPVSLRNLTVDFEKRTVTIDGRTYGPIKEQGFSIPLLDTVHPIMPSRTGEPW